MFAFNTCDSVWFTKNAPTMTIAFESRSSVMIFKGYLRCPSLSFVPILAIGGILGFMSMSGGYLWVPSWQDLAMTEGNSEPLNIWVKWS